jgi:hypothetical protein
MNRVCFTQNTNLHEQNQHASCIRPLKNNFVRMKMSLIIAVLIIITPVTMAQELVGTHNKVDNSATDLLSQIVSQNAGNEQVIVNHEMIRRFQEVKTEGDIYSWSQLLINHESKVVQEFMLSYRNCDLKEQSMENIKLALEEKSKEVAPLQADPEDEYYAQVRKIRQEISLRLGSGNPIAMK